MHAATFRFYAELNDFLPPGLRRRDVVHRFYGSTTVKDAIEALGVPHVEVDLILVNGESVGFEYRIHGGERVAVYPVFESLDVTPLVRLRGRPLRTPRFIADVHLGKLVRYLRLLGLDTVQFAGGDDGALVAAARAQARIILTRDRDLLKRSVVTHGYWVRSTIPVEQAREVVRRFDLTAQARPFTRCPTCNGHLIHVAKEAVIDRIPPKTARWQDEYYMCVDCGKLYWHGTHYPRLQATVARILQQPERPSAVTDNS